MHCIVLSEQKKELRKEHDRDNENNVMHKFVGILDYNAQL